MRRQKRRILVDEATSDTEKLQTDQIKLQMLRQEYARFSKSAKLRTQGERAEASGFGWKQANAASAEYKKIAKAANSMYDIGSEAENVKAYMRDLPIRKRIQSGKFPLNIHVGRQNKHIEGTKEYAQSTMRMRWLTHIKEPAFCSGIDMDDGEIPSWLLCTRIKSALQ